MTDIPFFSLSNDELENYIPVKKTIKCDKCKKEHPILFGDKVNKDGTKSPSKLLGYYKCSDKTYLASIAGKDITISLNK